jgi:hypothetical protein
MFHVDTYIYTVYTANTVYIDTLDDSRLPARVSTAYIYIYCSCIYICTHVCTTTTTAAHCCCLVLLPLNCCLQQQQQQHQQQLQDELAVLHSSKVDSVPWLPLQVAPFHSKGSGTKALWYMHGVPLLTYVLCTDEASDVLRRVALRRPDILSLLPAAATSATAAAATSDTAAVDTKLQPASAAALPRTALLWHSNFVYVDQVSCAICTLCICMY